MINERPLININTKIWDMSLKITRHNYFLDLFIRKHLQLFFLIKTLFILYSMFLYFWDFIELFLYFIFINLKKILYRT